MRRFILMALWWVLSWGGGVALAIQGGIPANPQHPNEPGQPAGTPGTPLSSPGVSVRTPGQTPVGVQAQATENAQTIAANNQSASTAATQTSIALRSLILAAHDSFDLWGNVTGGFNKVNTATINAGFDYRIKPKWVLGLQGNWFLARHIDGSAMTGGPYTAAAIGNWYLIASEIWRQEIETYTTYAQVGYLAKLGPWLTGPYYSVQYSTKDDLVQNQPGWYLSRVFGKLVPEAQVQFQNNCIRLKHEDRNFIWAGLTLNYELGKNFFLTAGYDIEANRHIQLSEVTLGFRTQF